MLQYQILGEVEWECIIKVCVDFSYQVKAIEVAETRSEEAAITNTWPSRCCVPSQASTVYSLAVDC